MGVGILAKRVVLELGSSTNFVYSLRAFRLCLSGNNLATHKFSLNTIFASILQAQSPENIEYSTFLDLLYHSNSSADDLIWLFFYEFY